MIDYSKIGASLEFQEPSDAVHQAFGVYHDPHFGTPIAARLPNPTQGVDPTPWQIVGTATGER